MVAEEKPLSELARAMTRFPQVLLNFAVANKRPFEEMPAVQQVIAARRPGTSAPTGGWWCATPGPSRRRA